MSVKIERDGPIATVILSRPDARNAVDRASADALSAAFLALEADDAIKVSVLFGAEGTFCAGADLKRLDNRLVPPTGEGLDATAPMGPSRLLLTKPVIAAIAGHAVAGGLELALWCDLRVAEADAVLGVFCRRWGVPLIDGGTIRLPRLIGLSRALDLILTGRSVTAEEALAIGLVNRLVPKGQARQAAETLAREIAAFPQGCMKNDRMSAYEQWPMSLGGALENEFRLGHKTLLGQEAQEGAKRFVGGAGRGGRFDD